MRISVIKMRAKIIVSIGKQVRDGRHVGIAVAKFSTAVDKRVEPCTIKNCHKDV